MLIKPCPIDAKPQIVNCFTSTASILKVFAKETFSRPLQNTMLVTLKFVYFLVLWGKSTSTVKTKILYPRDKKTPTSFKIFAISTRVSYLFQLIINIRLVTVNNLSLEIYSIKWFATTFPVLFSCTWWCNGWLLCRLRVWLKTLRKKSREHELWLSWVQSEWAFSKITHLHLKLGIDFAQPETSTGASLAPRVDNCLHFKKEM